MKSRNLIVLLVLLGSTLFIPFSHAANSGDEVVVVYNTRVPESRDIANHYAKLRQVPSNQVFGFDMPTVEAISRQDYRNRLENPLAKALIGGDFLHFGVTSSAKPDAQTNPAIMKVTDSKIRYLVLCYGVPLIIGKDSNLHEEGEEKLPAELRRNEASVDSELACLPLLRQNYLKAGPLNNPLYRNTNAPALNPTNGLLMVARLDGPTPAIARALVDKAMEAEVDGLWGRAYFDLRGITSGEYKLGEQWINGASEICRHLGFETVVDTNAATFPSSFPLSQVALYAGWYEESISGPFARPSVEFMPGAFAYHLHSSSAASLRVSTRHWVCPFLAKGVTATMGCVDEPYLAGTPDMATFFARFIYSGFTFGEAAYACQALLSWQTTVVGDPLYRPFGRAPLEQQADLERRDSKALEWFYLRAANFRMLNGTPAGEMIAGFEKLPLTKKSAVLSEKLADLYWQQGKPGTSFQTFRQALNLSPTPQQTVRIMLTMATHFLSLGKDQDAYLVYQDFLKKCPDYPDKAVIYKELVSLARKLNKKDEAEKFQQALDDPSGHRSSAPKQPALRPGV